MFQPDSDDDYLSLRERAERAHWRAAMWRSPFIRENAVPALLGIGSSTWQTIRARYGIPVTFPARGAAFVETAKLRQVLQGAVPPERGKP